MRSGARKIGLGGSSAPDESGTWDVIVTAQSSATQNDRVSLGREIKSIGTINVQGGCKRGQPSQWRTSGYDISQFDNTQFVAYGGCGGTFGVKFVPTGDKYSNAERDIRTIINKIESCAAPSDTPLPSHLRNLPAPPAGSPDNVTSAYELYLLARDGELSEARQNAAVLCSGGGGSTSDETVTGGGAASGGDWDTFEGGNVYADVPSAGPGPYTPGWNPDGGGSVIANPFAPPPPKPSQPSAWERMGTKGKVGVGVGGALALGGLVWLMMKKRKRKKR